MNRPESPAAGRQGHLSETQTATSQRPPASSREITAAIQAGVTELPCLVRELSEAEVVETQLVENCVDEDGHTGEPCHAVVIAERHDGLQAIAVCTERRRHTSPVAAK